MKLVTNSSFAKKTFEDDGIWKQYRVGVMPAGIESRLQEIREQGIDAEIVEIAGIGGMLSEFSICMSSDAATLAEIAR